MAQKQMLAPAKVYAVEISGVCNLESTCTWCPMNQRPRMRKRGLMTPDTAARALQWVERLGKVDALALHLFGEPLLHPQFDIIAMAFAKLSPVTMSTNAVLLDERWADKLARIPWAWISLSPWKREAVERAKTLLTERGIRWAEPPGVTHDFAGQATTGPKEQLFASCPFLEERKVSIRWDGSIASCCITDRAEDVIGHISQEPEEIHVRGYSICESCHHGRG